MALLSVDNRKKLFKACGLGDYNTENIKKLQKKYLRAKDVDGVYGTNTDNLLRHIYNVKTYTKNFKPEEFKCKCGGKYCTGYPTYMRASQLDALQTIRSHYKKPMTITCGLRCSGYNKALKGSVVNSRHLSGLACDYYIKGVTDTLANRTNAIKYLKTLTNHRYSYGNGIASNGTKPNTPNMGNALHTDCNDAKVTKAVAKAEETTQTTTQTTEVVATTTNAQKLGETAYKISWAKGTPEKKWSYKTGSPTAACKLAMKARGYDTKIEYSDCGYFMNTVVYHALGKKVKVITSDRKFNAVDGFEIAYSGTQIKLSQLKKYDIVRYMWKDSKGKLLQHVGMYMGDGYFAEAGRSIRFGVIHKVSKFTAKRTKVQILRVIEG